MLYEMLLIITPLITAPYISRILGADGVGIYSYTQSMMTFFTMFAALGTVSYGTREIAMHRDDADSYSKLFWEIEILTIITTMVCLAAWIAVIFFYADYRVYLIALIPTLIGTLFDISWFFTGHEKILYTVLVNSIVKIVSTILLFVLVKSKTDLVVYILLNSLAVMLGNLSMWYFLPSLLVKVDFKTLSFKRHFRETLIYFIPTIATTVYTVLDKTLIGLITKDNYQNGYYEQAYKIIKIIKTIVFTSVNSVMGARISYLYAQGKYDEIHKRIHRSMDFILLLGVGAVFGLDGIAKQFVPVFYGPGYSPVTMLLYLMSPLVVIIGISNCLGGQYYTPSGQRARSAKYIIVGSAVNLCLNLVLIPILQAQGAVIASIIAESVIAILYVVNSDGYMSFSMLFKMLYKRIAAGASMCIAVMMIGAVNFGNSIIGLFLQLLSGVIIYFGILAIFKDSMCFELLEIIFSFIKKTRNRIMK